MMRMLLILLVLCGPARAALTQAELDRVGVDLPGGASLPLGLDVPAVLIFADFDCAHICDAVLAHTADLLKRTGLSPGRDYRLVVAGLDPRDSAAMGEDFITRQAPPAMRSAIALRRPDDARLAKMTQTLGYGYVHDDALDTFAHPAARYVIAPDGAVTAALPAFGASEARLRDAIFGARIGAKGVATQLVLLCYGFDPATGQYSLALWRVLTALGLLTVLGIAALVGAALWRERRRA